LPGNTEAPKLDEQMVHRPLSFADNREREIDRLHTELYRARHAVLELVPDEFSNLLSSYYECSAKERHTWQDGVAEQVIERAKLLPPPHAWADANRARCPLCRAGTQSPYADGFTVPEGLRRHLIGWGSAQQCSVMHAAACLARDVWYDKFGKAEETQRQEELADKARRRNVEQLYRIQPDGDGQLRDDLWSGRRPRTDQEMIAAEDRLKGLKFKAEIEGRTQAYTRAGDGYVVYADPRASGAIEFRLYKQSGKRSKNGRIMWEKHYQSFEIPDRWHRELLSKFETRLATILGNRKTEP
jgi:hypothetical protein